MLWVYNIGTTASVLKLSASPETIPGLFLWVDANDISTLGFVSGSTTLLSSWNDKSGSSRNFIQDGVTYTTGDSYPIYLTSGQSQSTKNCIALSATSFYNDANAKFFINSKSTDFDSVSSFYTLFAVVKSNNTSSDVKIMSKAGNTVPRRILDTRVSSSSIVAGQGYDGDYASALMTNTSAINVYCYRWNSASSFDGFQGSIKRTGTITGTPSFGVNTNPLSFGLSIGFNPGTNYHGEATLNAEYCEVILYNRTLSDAEVLSVNSYLATKWSVV